MDTIDFNKHDIDIFINLAKIVRYGRYESCNEWRLLIIYFDGNFPNAKLRPYDDYKNMSTLNTYCGILSTYHNYKKIIIVDWILCPGIGYGKYSSLSKINCQWRKWRALAKSLDEKKRYTVSYELFSILTFTLTQ